VNATVISLGGGCDAAQALREFGDRRQSYPFDWLWNLDTGLDTICDIFVDGFATILDRDAYALSPHYRFPDELSVTYRDYPSVVHVHMDPLRNPDDHRTMVRRIKRL